MTKRVLLVALLALVGVGAAAPSSAAKGIETGARNGVTVNGSPYRYVAVSLHTQPKVTAVERIDMRDGRVERWWQLPGDYRVPAVAYDGSGGGLSADGRTLVLGRFPSPSQRVYPPKTTRLAILDTDLEAFRTRPAVSYVDLGGHFAFDAISPDGSTLYLIHYFQRLSRRPSYLARYEVRALDLESGRLLPEPIVDPEEPDERMEGLPLSRATSPDGRWAYTLYDGNGKEPFLHALDTVAGRAVCVDLPQLAHLHRRFFYLLQLRTPPGGRELVLWRRVPGPTPARPLLSVDTRSFAVRRPGPVATASSSVVPWLPIAALGAGAVALLAWLGVRRRGPRGTGLARRA